MADDLYDEDQRPEHGQHHEQATHALALPEAGGFFGRLVFLGEGMVFRRFEGRGEREIRLAFGTDAGTRQRRGRLFVLRVTRLGVRDLGRLGARTAQRLLDQELVVILLFLLALRGRAVVVLAGRCNQPAQR
ncbi:hypothetical protein D9M68_756360 [compost metagenome]